MRLKLWMFFQTLPSSQTIFLADITAECRIQNITIIKEDTIYFKYNGSSNFNIYFSNLDTYYSTQNLSVRG